jgi:hypothetical protein
MASVPSGRLNIRESNKKVRGAVSYMEDYIIDKVWII